MCLAVPMQIIEVKTVSTATVELGGSRLEVDVSLIENPRPGDFVIVHAGFAIERLDVEEANARLELFSDLAAAGAVRT